MNNSNITSNFINSINEHTFGSNVISNSNSISNTKLIQDSICQNKYLEDKISAFSNDSNNSKKKLKRNIKNNKNINSFMKNILSKVKDNLDNDDVKNEFFYPVYNEIYFRILPHYLTFIILLTIIIILLIVLLYLIINIKIFLL